MTIIRSFTLKISKNKLLEIFLYIKKIENDSQCLLLNVGWVPKHLNVKT